MAVPLRQTRRVRRTTMRSGRKNGKYRTYASSTGRPGGAKVGQKINDYPIPGGRFQRVTLELFQGQFALSWFDRFPSRSNNKRYDRRNRAMARNACSGASNAEAGIDMKRCFLWLCCRQCHRRTGSHSDDMAGSNDNDLSVAAFEDKPKRNKVKYQCRGCGAAVWAKPD